MQLSPIDEIKNLVEIVKKCGMDGDAAAARRAHACILKTQHRSNRYVVNCLIEMYGKCGCPAEASEVFQRISCPNVFTWNLLITAYAHNGHLGSAKDAFDKMPHKDIVTWNAILAAFAHTGCIEQAVDLFKAAPEKDALTWNSLLQAYVQAGQLQEAKDVLDRMPARVVQSWNAMTCAYGQTGDVESTLAMFRSMPEWDEVSWNIVTQVLASEGHLDMAVMVFEAMPQRSIVSWNTMLHVTSLCGQPDRVKEVFFHQMPEHDAVSCSTVVAACVETAGAVAAEMRFTDRASLTALVVASDRLGRLDKAVEHFQQMPVWDSAAISAVIAAFVRSAGVDQAAPLVAAATGWGLAASEDAVLAFTKNRHMQESDTTSSVELSCSTWMPKALSTEKTGASLTSPLMDQMAGGDPLILLQGYAQRGHIKKVVNLFEQLPCRSEVVVWTIMIQAYARAGHGEAALELLRLMELEAGVGDDITFISILAACIHIGQLSTGVNLFRSMVFDRGINPGLEHYSSMIDLFHRSGQHSEADELLASMPLVPDERVPRIIGMNNMALS